MKTNRSAALPLCAFISLLALLAGWPACAFAQESFIEGNSLSDRFFNTDNAPTNAQFVLDFPITRAGKLDQLLVWGQNSGFGIPGVGESFMAYVLRPVSGYYQVLLRTEYLTVANVGLNTFSVPPFPLQTGDFIGHYGRGVPLNINTDGPSSVFDNNDQPLRKPEMWDLLELPGPEYPLYNDGGRDYAIALRALAFPSLTINRSGNSVVVWWPGANTDVLLQTANLGGAWTTNTSFTSANGTNTLIVPASAGSMFFRLGNP